MPLELGKIKDDNWYTVAELEKILGKTQNTIRTWVEEKLPTDFRIDQNKNGKFRKYLVSGKGVKFLLGVH